MHTEASDRDVMPAAVFSDDYDCCRTIFESVVTDLSQRWLVGTKGPFFLGDVLKQPPHGNFPDTVLDHQTPQPSVQYLFIRNPRDHRRNGNPAITWSSLANVLHAYSGRNGAN